MKYLKICIILVLTIILNACNCDEIFEREQYKHVIALLSDGTYNIFAEEHESVNADAEGFTEGYIAASCGGSLPTTETVTLNLIEDASLLWEYNNNSFATESYKYAHYLPSDRYKVDNHIIVIPQGERSGRMKIQVRADNLSPDSVYFIPFRVVQSSAYELNSNKSTVLYQVYLKNYWASAKSIPVYSHRGIKLEEESTSPVNTMITKKVYPVSSNEVRIFAGNKIISEPTVSLIEKWAIRLSMDDDGNVTIYPWRDSLFGMRVTQVDGDTDFPNVFRLIDNGYGTIYKTFLLCYDYVDPDEGITYRMKEELRIENTVTVK